MSVKLQAQMKTVKESKLQFDNFFLLIFVSSSSNIGIYKNSWLIFLILAGVFAFVLGDDHIYIVHAVGENDYYEHVWGGSALLLQTW